MSIPDTPSNAFSTILVQESSKITVSRESLCIKSLNLHGLFGAVPMYGKTTFFNGEFKKSQLIFILFPRISILSRLLQYLKAPSSIIVTVAGITNSFIAEYPKALHLISSTLSGRASFSIPLIKNASAPIILQLEGIFTLLRS